jgi:photosystem II stability/assembly factor-like uncharacterized protein
MTALAQAYARAILSPNPLYGQAKDDPMKRIRPLLLAIAAMALWLLTSCTIEITPAPEPAATPTTLPSATPTLVLPTPTPAGLLPNVIASLDLGLKMGDAYWPYSVAVDGETAYVLCQRIGDRDEGPPGIAIVDLATGQVRAVWPLEVRPIGPLAVAAGRVVLLAELGEGGARLLALDAQSGRTAATADIAGFIHHSDPLLVNPKTGQIYVSLYEGILLFDAQTLEPMGTLPLPDRPGERHVIVDAPGDRIYVALNAELYAYSASDLALLWQTEVPVQRIPAMILDDSREHLVVQGVVDGGAPGNASLFIYSTQGALQGQVTPEERTDFWTLAWADASSGRMVLQTYDYGVAGIPMLECWAIDWQGRLVDSPRRWHRAQVVASATGSGHLYLLGAGEHRVTRVRARDLEVDGRVTLGVQLNYLVVGDGGRRIWVNSTAGDLFELDAEHAAQGQLRVVRQLDNVGSGALHLYSPGGLLLAALAEGDPQRVSVIDLEHWRVSHVITGGNDIALDTRRARALVGNRTPLYPPHQGTVEVWDLVRGERVGSLPMGGPPAYNPLRDEIIIAGYGAQVFDAETLQATRSLTPDIDAQTCPGCTGQPAAIGVSVAVEHNLLMLHMTITTAGKGPGTLPPPRFFALDTLEPVSHAVTYWQACGGGLMLWPPIDGRILHSVHFARYVAYANTVVQSAVDGEILDWRDGLAIDLLTPDGRVALTHRGDEWLALDTVDWQPLGAIEPQCVHAYASEADLFYALSGSELRVLSPRWGKPLAQPAPSARAPQGAVRALRLASTDGQELDLFVVTDDGLYHSHDGETWQRLSDTLPGLDATRGLHLSVAVSPDYAQDGTVFVGGWLGSFGAGNQGLGVWRSNDGGETWQPLWRGLTHLNVETLAISPRFAEDSTLLAYCQYTDLLGGDSGRSLFRSDDGGESWRLVERISQSDAATRSLPTADDLLAPMRAGADGKPTPSQQVRLAMGGSAVERLEGGEWVMSLRLSLGEYALDLMSNTAAPAEVFLLTERALYRSPDAGRTWARGVDERIPTERLTALAGGGWTAGAGELAIGDDAGRIIRLSVADLTWEPFSPDDGASAR